MTKLERSRCEKLIDEANKNIYEAKEQWSKYEKCKEEGNAVKAEIALRDFEAYKGYAEGIYQALTVVGYNSEDFINLMKSFSSKKVFR